MRDARPAGVRPGGPRALACLALALVVGLLLVGTASAQDRILTIAVLVNSTNTTGFNPNPISPGEFQRYPERYLEHLQAPYQLIDVSTVAPPADLSKRQLILAGHKNLNLSAAWRTAISTAVNGGVGFVNLDWDPTVGTQSHIASIFGASGSSAGTPGTAISVPAAVRTGGATPHFIAGLQRAFQGDTIGPNGELVYDFHADTSGVVRSVTSTVLTGVTGGTVVATIGSNPLILAKTFGQGRAVHFGTLDYLRADRFGFVQGVDDLFWRSLVWAARKPFVLRGYPRLWAVQMDDTFSGWGFRVKDLYDPSLTGTVKSDGTGGPWKVTGYVFLDHLTTGTERTSVIADINAGSLKLVPHAFANTTCGDIYWNGPLARQYTDSEWLTQIGKVMSWKLGQGGADQIPPFSRSMVAHYWNLGNNTGSDLWSTFGYRYVTSILKPGFQNCNNLGAYNGAERPHARPFWIYEQPPKNTLNEDYAFFFADDYPVNSRAGQQPANMFLFTTQLQDPGFYSRPDVMWPGASSGLTASIEQFERVTWRFWSSLAPVQIFTHDGLNYASSTVTERQDAIRNVSSFLETNGVRHVFMEELGDYIYSRTKSALVGATLTGTNVTYTFTGNAATADNQLVQTRLLVFFNDSSEPVSKILPGFTGGLTTTQPLGTPPPDVTSVSPSSGSVSGGTSVTIGGTNFVGVSQVTIGGVAALNFVVNSSTSITATTPAGTTGPADVAVVTATGTGVRPSGFTYLGAPKVTTIDPNFGPVQGGTSIRISGQGFEASSTVRLNGTFATGVTFVDSTTLIAVTPAGPAGPVPVQVTNSFGTTSVSAGFYYGDTIRLNFTYSSRSQLLGAGWDFLARTSSGVNRDTEQTSGLTVNYDQTAHPGAIRIPVDQGDIFEQLNSSRNTLFFTLPSHWRSIKLKLKSFVPNDNFQQAALVAYQDDDNYVILSKNFNNGTFIEFAREISRDYSVFSKVNAPSGATLFLRLDRDRPTETITASYSTDGVNWTAMTGTAGLVLNNPRLGILVGANTSGTPANADIEFAEIVAVDDPPMIGATPASLTFSAVQGGGNPATQPLAISNDGGGVVNWSASPGATWLSLSPTSGLAPSSTTVSVNTSGLTAGTYNANITVTSSGAANTPRLIPVTLTVGASAAPTITGITPAGGSTAGGTPVQITGTSFTAGTTVSIGGAPATSVAVVSTSLLTAVTPPGVVGTASVTIGTTFGSAALSNGFAYVAPGGLLLRDTFSGTTATGWTMSPLGGAANWSVVNGAYVYNGNGHSLSYRGDTWWSDYTVSAKFRLSSLNNYPGGIRGRINTATGAGYVLWMYPATRELKLFRAPVWFIDSPGLTQLATIGNIPFDTTSFHTLRMTFRGTIIDVYYDNVLVMSATDASFTNGVVALDVATQPVQFDDVTVWLGVPANSALSVAPPTSTLSIIGQTQQLQVTAIGPNGNGSDVTTSPSTTYSSSNTAVAQVNATGLVTAAANGTARIDIVNGDGNTGALVTVDTTLVSVTGITPASGSTAGGTVVQINGSGFTSASTVTIGGAPATNVVANSSVLLSATTPAGTAGRADVVVTTGSRTATLAQAFTYLAGGNPLLLRDDFSSGTATGWTISPQGNAAGWSVVNGVYTYAGGINTQSYRGDAWWSDYTLSVNFRLSSVSNYPGGIRGRVNPATGAGYAAWMYPASGQIILYRASQWNINGPGLTQLGSVSGITFNTNLHNLRMTFRGSTIDVYYDGTRVLTASDTTLASGVIALDVDSRPIGFDDVTVWFGSGLSSVAVAPPTATLMTIGSTVQLAVTGTWLDGTTGDLTSDPGTTYTSTNMGVAQVNTTGRVTAIASGTARIDATNNGVTGSSNVTVDTSVVTATGITPSSGPTTGGTTVQITGTGFTAGTTVTIGGVAATGVVVNSNTLLTAVTPAGSSGPKNVVVTTSAGSATITSGFSYAPPSSVLLQDSFGSGTATGWTISPLGNAAGWSVVNGVYTYNGGGPTQSYRGDSWWTDYTLSVKVRLSTLSNYPGGIRGRVNSSTGAGYALWMYPATGELKLYRATGWDINTAGLTQIGGATGIVFDTANFHTLRMTFRGSIIEVYYDGVRVMTGIDSTYASGVIALDVVNQPVSFDDVLVTFDTLAGITPASGPTAGGTAVQIQGSGFTAGSTVTIGGAPATSVVVNSDINISAVTPARPAGPTDVVVQSGTETKTLSSGFKYVAPANSVLMSDDFADGNANGWVISPLGLGAGWSVLAGAYHYNGGGHTQSYRGEAWWTDYTVSVRTRLSSLNNFPGGIRGRVNPSTGASYALWMYPASGQIILYRATAWNIDTAGLTQLGVAGGIPFDTTNFHTLRLTFQGSTIQVYYDTTLVLTVTDTAYTSGVIALDVVNQPIDFDDIAVSTLP
jgi:IPT/TIG domain-containing protein/Big-like domain-containing protein/BACON domain-containing protein/3-keto-disaccharide hydrolase/beta-xylosidase-like protein